MEPESLTWQEVGKLDKLNLKLMRKALGKANSTESADVMRHLVENRMARRAFGTHSIGSIPRKRGLNWMLEMVQHPEENVQLRAAMSGSHGATRSRIAPMKTHVGGRFAGTGQGHEEHRGLTRLWVIGGRTGWCGLRSWNWHWRLRLRRVRYLTRRTRGLGRGVSTQRDMSGDVIGNCKAESCAILSVLGGH